MSCTARTFEITGTDAGEEVPPDDEDPVGSASFTRQLGLRYRCGDGAEQVAALTDLNFECHGAGCAATVTVRGDEVETDDPDGGLSDDDVAAVRAAIPDGSVLTYSIVTVAERAFAELTTFDVVPRDDGFDVQRRAEDGPETLASIRP